MQSYGLQNDLLGFANWCCTVEQVCMHYGLCHLVTLGSQVDHSHCLQQYSPSPWSLDLMRRQDKALFYSRQRPNLGLDDRRGHCAGPPEHGFQQYCMAMLSIVVSACLWEGMLRAKHLCSSQQFPIDHLNSTDACNKMHKQQFSLRNPPPQKKMPQMPFLELLHVYIYYMTLHIQFGCQILPTAIVMSLFISSQHFWLVTD